MPHFNAIDDPTWNSTIGLRATLIGSRARPKCRMPGTGEKIEIQRRGDFDLKSNIPRSA